MEILNLKNIKQIIIINELPSNFALQERDYFSLLNNKKDMKNFYLIGDDTDQPYLASINDEKFIISYNKSNLYLVGSVPNFGISLVHYILDIETGILSLCSDIPVKKLNIKEDDFMSTINLQSSRLNSLNLPNQTNAYNNMYGNNINPSTNYDNNMDTNNMNINNMNTNNMNQTGLKPLQRNEINKIPTLAVLGGYIYGYIVKQAPETYIKYVKLKDKNRGDQYDIKATQSKPSKVLKVLMALPASVATNGGALALPSDISRCDIEFDENNKDVYKIAVSEVIAVSYIDVLGKRLPEYAPTHIEGQKEHWSFADIGRNNPKVTYVKIGSKVVSKRKTNIKETHYVLIPDGRRRSLFTENNFFPLKVAEHTDVTSIKTEQDSYEINKMAFLSWTKKPSNKNESSLESAYKNCPALIFKRNYTFDTGEKIVDENGKEVNQINKIDGTCCVYFMPENAKVEREKIGEDGKKAISFSVKKELTYIPWYKMSIKDSKPIPETLNQIVTKETRITKNGSIQVRKIYHDLKNQDIKVETDPYFKPYLKFYKGVLEYIEEDELRALAGTTKHEKKLTEQDIVTLGEIALEVSNSSELSNIVTQLAAKKLINKQAM